MSLAAARNLESRPDSAAENRRNTRISDGELDRMFRQMLLIRAFERRTEALFAAGTIRGTAHSCIGQEATAVGAMAALGSRDHVASYHRGHGHCIARGADPGRMMAELLGKATGYCGGLGGSMHIADMDLGILGANGIVGASMPLGTGTALTAQLRGHDGVTVAFFGDGASNEGAFHEAANLASVWKLPMIFFCENNGYSLTSAYAETSAAACVADRAAAYAMPASRVDGNDVEAVALAMEAAVERARQGLGPTLVEAMTYRHGQHSMRANLREPRPEAEIDSWKARDPILRARAELLRRGAADEADLAAAETEAETLVDAALRFAEDSAEPDLDMMMAAVLAPRDALPEPDLPTDRMIGFPEALAEALAQEMERDKSVFLLGEDIGPTGGIFGATRGLAERFGTDRVRDTPISEGVITGCGVGAALAGMRPVVEMQFFDFVTLAMDMIVNQAAKLRFMLGGSRPVPLVVRGPQGGGIRVGAQHSQCIESWFTHIPGLVVIAPSTPYDAKGLLAAAIRDDNPVIFLEHKLLYVAPPAPVPEERYLLPIGKGVIRREGHHVTVVATMAMVARALSAAGQLAREGIEVEVIDPRTLAPLDEELIFASVRKTNRLLIVHEAWSYGGFAAEVTARVVDQVFDWLDAPVARLTGMDTPMPYNGTLEREVMPSVAKIVAKIRALLE